VGRHVRLSAPKPKKGRPKKKPEGIDEILQDYIDTSMILKEAIKQQIDEGMCTPAMIREFNGLGRMVGSLAKAQTDLKTARRRWGKNLKPAQMMELILEWVRQTPPEKLQPLRELLAQVEEENDAPPLLG